MDVDPASSVPNPEWREILEIRLGIYPIYGYYITILVKSESLKNNSMSKLEETEVDPYSLVSWECGRGHASLQSKP